MNKKQKTSHETEDTKPIMFEFVNADAEEEVVAWKEAKDVTKIERELFNLLIDDHLDMDNRIIATALYTIVKEDILGDDLIEAINADLALDPITKHIKLVKGANSGWNIIENESEIPKLTQKRHFVFYRFFTND